MSDRIALSEALGLCETDDERAFIEKCVNDGMIPAEGEGDARRIDKAMFEMLVGSLRGHVKKMKPD